MRDRGRRVSWLRRKVRLLDYGRWLWGRRGLWVRSGLWGRRRVGRLLYLLIDLGLTGRRRLGELL